MRVGIGSGNWDRIKEKNGVYKIIGFTDKDSDHYWYLGVTKHFACKLKSYYTYIARKPGNENNALFKKIRELNFDFDMVELELLPKDFDFYQAKLYLQKNYLDLYSPSANKANFSFGEKPAVKNPHQKKDKKKDISELYLQGIKTKDIAKMYGITDRTVQSILRTMKVSKGTLHDEVEKRFMEGENIDKLIEEFKLTPYMIKKLLNTPRPILKSSGDTYSDSIVWTINEGIGIGYTSNDGNKPIAFMTGEEYQEYQKNKEGLR